MSRGVFGSYKSTWLTSSPRLHRYLLYVALTSGNHTTTHFTSHSATTGVLNTATYVSTVSIRTFKFGTVNDEERPEWSLFRYLTQLDGTFTSRRVILLMFLRMPLAFLAFRKRLFLRRRGFCTPSRTGRNLITPQVKQDWVDRNLSWRRAARWTVKHRNTCEAKDILWRQDCP